MKDSPTQSSSFSEEFRRYIALAWKWAWLLLLATMLAAGVAYWQSRKAIPVYQAYTRLLVIEAAQSVRAMDYSTLIASERAALTYTELIVARPILEETAARLDGGVDADYLIKALQRKVLRINPVQNTNIIDLWLEDIDGERAAQALNMLVTVFVEENGKIQSNRFTDSKDRLQSQMDLIAQQIKDTQAQLDALGNNPANKAEQSQLAANLTQYQQTSSYLLQSYEQVRIVEAQSTSSIIQVVPAVPPAAPLSSKVLLNTLLAGVVGLLMASGMIFLIEALDDTIKTPDEIRRLFDLPVLGIIFRHVISDRKPIAIETPLDPVTDAFRTLRANIQYSSVDKPIHSLLITSPTPEVGKTTLAANLAIVLSQAGRSVTLVDADLRRPDLHELMNVPNRKGLSELFLEPEVNLGEFLHQDGLPGLGFLSAGQVPPNPPELLNSDKMSDILNQIRQESDITVIDSAPVLAVSDSLFLSEKVDATLLIVKPGVTTRVALRQAIEKLNQVGAKIIGVVFNDVVISRTSPYYYSSYYYSHKKYYGKDSGDGGEGHAKESTRSRRSTRKK